MEILRHPFGRARSLKEELRRAVDLARVADIASPIAHVLPAGTPLSEVGAIEFELDHFYAVVTERGRVVGAVDKATLDAHAHERTTTLGALAQRIGAEQVVAGSTPALEALFALRDEDHPVWVICGRDIDHELWFWDFEDSLVRLSLFGMLLVLEDALSLRASGAAEECLSVLPPGRWKLAESTLRKRHGEGSGDVLRATSFNDKLLMVKALPHVFGFDASDTGVGLALESAIDVRNAISHGDLLRLRPGPGEDAGLVALMSPEEWKQCVSSWMNLLRTLDPDIDLNFDRRS